MKNGKRTFERLRTKFDQWKLPMLIVLFGIGLMLLPEKSESTETTQPQMVDELQTMQNQLETLLAQIDGAGQVSVMLSMETGTSVEYQQDVTSVQSQDRTELRKQTVLLGQNQAVPVQTTYGTYRGAVVVCQGADRPSVCLRIMQAVSSLTGLGSDKISVIKMKRD